MDEPRLLREILASIPRGEELLRMATLRDRWGEIIGGKAAANTKPSRLVGKRLFVTTRDAVWANQLTLMKREILARVEEVLPGALNDIRFSPASWAEERGASRAESIEITLEEEAELRKELRGAPKELHEKLVSAAASAKKIGKLRVKRGWRPCPSCGALSPPDGCATCRGADEAP